MKEAAEAPVGIRFCRMQTNAPAGAAPTAPSRSRAASLSPRVAPGAFDARPPRMKNSRDSRPRRGGARGDRERIKPEFDTKMIDIRRVTRVAAGGRRFTFSVAVVSGDKKGRVGVGLGKAIDTTLAIDKATRDAKKHMIKIALTPTMSIPHSVYAKYSSARVEMMPVQGPRTRRRFGRAQCAHSRRRERRRGKAALAFKEQTEHSSCRRPRPPAIVQARPSRSKGRRKADHEKSAAEKTK